MTFPHRYRTAALSALAAGAVAQSPPIEFGAIAWQRDLTQATAAARTAKLPLLLLFQEVPG